MSGYGEEYMAFSFFSSSPRFIVVKAEGQEGLAVVVAVDFSSLL